MITSVPLALFNGTCLGTKPTGIGVVARDLIDSLDPDLVQLLDPLGGSRLGSIPIPSNVMPEFGNRGHVRRLFWTQQRIPSLLKQTGAQLLLSPVPEAPLFRGVRSVVLAHDLLPLRHPQPTPLLAYHLTYVPLVLHRAVRVLCNSDATARELHSRLGIPVKKLITIPLGFNPKNLYPMECSREGYFLVLGRHDPHKNIARVLYAFSLLKETTIQLWFVGPEDRRYTPNLKRIAFELGISNRCKWIPWATDQERLELLNRCQALIIASLWEGFGLPALEAMACNTPVIASDSGAIPEVVADAGLMINPKDPVTIADAMRQVIIDRALTRNLVNNGKERIKSFTWAKAAKKVEIVLKDIAR